MRPLRINCKCVSEHHFLGNSTKTFKDKGKTISKDDSDFQVLHVSFQKSIDIHGVDGFNGIRPRVSPELLLTAIRSLNDCQKKCVETIGFGALLKMVFDGVPLRIAHFVVNNFKGDTMEILLKTGNIKLSKETLYDALGVPIGGAQLVSMDNFDSSALLKWKEQFDVKLIRPHHVLGKIISSTWVDWLFVVNFIVLFCSIFVGCKSNGTLNLEVVEFIAFDRPLADIDWCGFVIQSIRENHQTWKVCDRQAYYNGTVALFVDLVSQIGYAYQTLIDADEMLHAKIQDAILKFPNAVEFNVCRRKILQFYKNKVESIIGDAFIQHRGGKFGLCEEDSMDVHNSERNLKSQFDKETGMGDVGDNCATMNVAGQLFLNKSVLGEQGRKSNEEVEISFCNDNQYSPVNSVVEDYIVALEHFFMKNVECELSGTFMTNVGMEHDNIRINTDAQCCVNRKLDFNENDVVGGSVLNPETAANCDREPVDEPETVEVIAKEILDFGLEKEGDDIVAEVGRVHVTLESNNKVNGQNFAHITESVDDIIRDIAGYDLSTPLDICLEDDISDGELINAAKPFDNSTHCNPHGVATTAASSQPSFSLGFGFSGGLFSTVDEKLNLEVDSNHF